MNIYRFDEQKMEWQLIQLNECSILGLDKRGKLHIGESAKMPLAWLSSYADGYGKVRWAIIPTPESPFRLNGLPMFSLHVLSERDELSYDGQRLYFTYEQPPAVVTCAPQEGDPPIFCPRCKDVVEGPAVKCPGSCGLWYHERAGRNCWSYDEKCSVCGRPTAEGLTWKPAPILPKVKWRNRRHEQTT